MHRTDANGNVGNMFDSGDPLVPRLPTQLDKHWLNAVQEEIVGVILDAGIALVKGTNTQLLSALRNLFVRTTGSAAQTITGVKSFTSTMNVTGSTGGGSGIVVNGGPSGNGTAGVFAASGTADAVSATAAGAGSAGVNGTGVAFGVKGSAGTTGVGVRGAGLQGVTGVANTTSTTASGVTGDGASTGAYGVIAQGNASGGGSGRAAFRIVPQSAAPTLGVQMGDLYVNSSDGKLYIYNGSAWVVVGTQT